jgi:hypothetical protein
MYKILSLVALIIIGSLGYLFLMPDNSKIAEVVEVQNIEQKKPVKTEILETTKSGSFIAIDLIHKASGSVRVKKVGNNYEITFADNFISADGPDLYVYLSEPQNFKNIAIGGVDTSKTLNIGKLKNTKGGQTYTISAKDFERYNSSIIIWCKQFGVQFSRADLK